MNEKKDLEYSPHAVVKRPVVNALRNVHCKTPMRFVLLLRSRRSNLHLVGIPEGMEGTQPTKFFAEALQEIGPGGRGRLSYDFIDLTSRMIFFGGPFKPSSSNSKTELDGLCRTAHNNPLRKLDTSCLAEYTYKNTNGVGRRQPMTSLPVRLVAAGASLPARPQYKRASVEQDGLFFVFTDFLSGVCKTVRDTFYLIMASTSKAFRKCADPCPRFLTPDDTHDLCVFCLGEEHARDILEGAVCVHCERFPMKKLRSRLSLFSREEGQPPVSRGSGPSAAEARRKMSSWGSQVDLADELKKGLSLSRSSVADEDELLADDDVISLTSSDPAASALLQEEQEMLEGEEAEAEPSLISCPALDLPWKRAREVAPRGRLDERFLSDHNLPAQVSFPFLPDLHTEIEKIWRRPYSSRIHNFPHSNYANIAGMREHGYQRLPPVEETLASYLSLGKVTSLKTPSLPSIPLQVTSRLNGRAYAAAGQAVGTLHTMAVLQAYQADLLKDLDKGQGLSPDEVAELRRTMDLALRATKQAATAMGRSMGAMVVTERHLWVNLADLGKKERGFLLDAPVSHSELFGASVETVVEKFREARMRSAAFKTFIPRRSRSEPEQRGGPGPSRSGERRQAQKTSVATCAPPPPAGGSGRKRGSSGGRQDLREVIQTRQRARLDQAFRFLKATFTDGLDLPWGCSPALYAGSLDGVSNSGLLRQPGECCLPLWFGIITDGRGGSSRRTSDLSESCAGTMVLFEHPPLVLDHGYGLLARICLRPCNGKLSGPHYSTTS
ncbi:Lamina-associated polypeptide 2, isoform alpha [Labeo rohita]|uniref:Lamina-associated polypeptide 2, isoform alpha n=1 Tax=Labeo rohita TaxID=84645 RepID=A0ABQ8LSX3_LABRO|nr:Lamina-associated polypeptide 2, isoform alpha [Labeo rohita]